MVPMNNVILTPEEAWKMVMNNNRNVTTSSDNMPQYVKSCGRMCIWWPDDWACDPVGNGDKESFLKECGDKTFMLV